MVSAGGAVVVAVSLLYTARSYRLSHHGQVTDRFTKALERLNSSDIDARLGAIHALAHVANDSRPHHDDVVEVFLRRRSSGARHDAGPTLAARPRLPERPDSDIQAALTALGRRPNRPERRSWAGQHLARRLAGLEGIAARPLHRKRAVGIPARCVRRTGGAAWNWWSPAGQTPTPTAPADSPAAGRPRSPLSGPAWNAAPSPPPASPVSESITARKHQ